MSSGGSGQNPVTTTQTSDPWSGAQPYLTDVMGRASGLANADTGYGVFTGPTQVNDTNPWLNQGLNATAALGQTDLNGSPGVNAARNLAQEMIGSKGLTDIHTTALGQIGNIGHGYGALGSQYGNVFSEAAGNENPYLLGQIAANDRRIGDRVNSTMSGAGRYGSGAHTDVLSRSLAEAANPILAADYESRKNRQLSALAGEGSALAGQQGAWTNFADIGSQGLGRAAAFAQAVPGWDAARYTGAQALTGAGEWDQARRQNEINAQMQRFNVEQARPWEQLARYSGIVGGMGGLGGTKVTQSPNTSPSQFQRGLGGAAAGGLLGSMLMPGIGTGIGAGIGGLGGLFL